MAALPQEPPLPGEGEVEDEPPDLSERPSARLRRDADLLGRSNSACRKWLRKRFDAIAQGFEQQADRSDDLDRFWRAWFCELDDRQFYNGTAEVYVPIIHDAIEARSTRFANQLFPQSGRYVEVTTSDGEQPYEIVALLNHYIKNAKLKTQVVKPLLRNGDIEGQLNLYVDWEEIERQIVSRETRGTMIDGAEIDNAPEAIVDIKEEDVVEGHPCFEVLHDSDVLVLPQTADSIEQALENGGCAVIVRRWSKDKKKEMAASGDIAKEFADDDSLSVEPNFSGLKDIPKALARIIGVRAKGAHFIAFEVWQKVPLNEKGAFDEDGTKRLCRTWYDLDREPMGLKRNPYWNDRCPLLSAPVQKVAGVFKGKSLVEPLMPLQYEANDAANERADADHYSAMPIIARTPSEGAKPLVLNLAAIWDIPPNDVKFMAFPDLSARANARIIAATQLIFQSLSVTPAMLPQQSGRPGAKRNQAEVAMEQQVELLSVAEAVEVPADLLTEAAEWMVDLDHQFRDRPLTIRQFGEMGIHANMENIPVLQNRHAYNFAWSGSQQQRSTTVTQQQGTAFINVLRGMKAELQAEGFELRLGPILEQQAIAIFGATTGPLVLIDRKHQLTIPIEVEGQLLMEGHEVPVHPMDNDAEHVQRHQAAMQQEGDPWGTIRVHIALHLQQMALKQQAAMKQALAQAVQQQGAPGVPGGAGPGVAGTPQPGAVPTGPRQFKGPAGAIHPDQMNRSGVLTMPRRT